MLWILEAVKAGGRVEFRFELGHDGLRGNGGQIASRINLQDLKSLEDPAQSTSMPIPPEWRDRKPQHISPALSSGGSPAQVCLELGDRTPLGHSVFVLQLDNVAGAGVLEHVLVPQAATVSPLNFLRTEDFDVDKAA